jgi:Na+-translocating ferredoxin:NAD+ oxidoreductase subunit B
MVTVYEKLRERLDKFPQGFPKSKSGVEMKILEDLFTPEEAEIALSLRPYPNLETASTVAQRAGKNETKLGETLFGMSKKGLILRYRASETDLYYCLVPWIVGIYEFQVNNLTKDRIHMWERYYEEARVPSLRGRPTGTGFRVIPIEKEIQGKTAIQSYERVSQIIESNTVFAVADCICRKERAIVGDGCGKLQEACLSFGPGASYYLENGIAREISKEEAKGILLKAEEEGLVHCSSNTSSAKMFIFNCCSCCCGVMKNVTKYGNPNVITKSNYYAVNDTGNCNACGICVERCQVHAIRIEDDVAIIERDRCIGCGLCVSMCATGSLSLAAKSPDEASPVFIDDVAMYQALGQATGKSYPFE